MASGELRVGNIISANITNTSNISTSSVNSTKIISEGAIVNVVNVIDANRTYFAGAAGWEDYHGLDYTYYPKQSNSKLFISFGIMMSTGGASGRVKPLINGEFPLPTPEGGTNFEGCGQSVFMQTANSTQPRASILAYASQFSYDVTDKNPVAITFQVYTQSAVYKSINYSAFYTDESRGETQSYLTIMEISSGEE